MTTARVADDYPGMVAMTLMRGGTGSGRELGAALAELQLGRSRLHAAAQLCIAVERYMERYAEADEAVRRDLWRKMGEAADVFRDNRTTIAMFDGTHGGDR